MSAEPLKLAVLHCSAGGHRPPLQILETGAPRGGDHSNLSGRFLRVPRIVSRIYVVDLPRSDAVKLDNCFTFRPRRVFHASRPVTERPGGKLFGANAIERFSCRKIKSTRNHSDPLSLRMGMRRDMIALRKLKTHYKGTFFRRIAFEYSHPCARRQSRWPCFPFNSRWRIKTHVCALRLFGR